MNIVNMKTRSEILYFFRQQPWYREFINCCIKDYKFYLSYNGIIQLSTLSDKDLIDKAFWWKRYDDCGIDWSEVNNQFHNWYHGN